MTVTPTSFDSAFGDLAREMIAESGRSLLLRQPTRVESQSGSNAGAVVSSPLSESLLAVVGDEYPAFEETAIAAAADSAAGGEQLSLRFPAYGPGWLVPGDELEIAGHSEVYVVTGGIFSLNEDATDLESVTITPALEFAVEEDEPITLFPSSSREFVAAGENSIDLDATGVAGVLVAGDSFTYGGVTYTFSGTYYPVTADALSGVQFSPALAEPLAGGTVLTIDFAGTFTAIKGVVSAVSHRWIASGVAKIGDLQVMLSRVALEAAGVTLAVGDELHLGATAAAPLYAIEAVLPLASGELDAAYTVIARAR